MKHLKNFKLFESINEEDIKLSEIEPYLLDFKQLGCDWTISFSNSTDDIDFPDNKLYIPANNLDKYCKWNKNIMQYDSIRTLDIELRPEGDFLSKIKMSLEEFSDAVSLISDYLNSDHGLELYYIYISNDWSYLYFPSVENVLKSDYAKIIANRITLSFR